MDFWSVKNVQKYYNSMNPSLSTVKKFYAMLHKRYYGTTTLVHRQPANFEKFRPWSTCADSGG